MSALLYRTLISKLLRQLAPLAEISRYEKLAFYSILFNYISNLNKINELRSFLYTYQRKSRDYSNIRSVDQENNRNLRLKYD
jgi:hypothetical protein